MADEINFIDLACLLKITPDTTLEKFGSAINGAFFDASNLAGTLKQKSLIDFSSYYPGPTIITVSDAGKALVAEAEAKSAEPIDKLDQEILFQMSGGKRLPIELQNSLNIRSKDLALHIYKLSKQGLLIYELKSGSADLQLTEAGFIKAKASQPKPETPPAAAMSPKMEQPKPTMPSTSDQSAMPAEPAVQPMMPKTKSHAMRYLIIFIAIVIIVAILFAIYYPALVKKYV